MSKLKLEHKMFGGAVTECKEVTRDGVNLGIVEGYIATWDLDSGNGWYKDQFEKGAFAESIKEHKKRNNRPIRLKDHHGRTVGGFPINTVKEDDRGLFGIGEINLDVQQGAEAYALVKQGVLSDFSVGFSAEVRTFDEEREIRTIHKATVWEGSIVDEPMNQQANITAVKGFHSFDALPLADKSHSWDSEKALSNLMDYIESKDDANELKTILTNSFMWFDIDGTKSDCKLQIVDVVDGELRVVPEAVIHASNTIIEKGFSGLGITDDDGQNIVKVLEKYCGKLSIPSPFEGDMKQYFRESDLATMTERQFENVLKTTGSFSRSAVKALISTVYADKKEGYNSNSDEEYKEILSELNSISESIKSL